MRKSLYTAEKVKINIYTGPTRQYTFFYMLLLCLLLKDFLEWLRILYWYMALGCWFIYTAEVMLLIIVILYLCYAEDKVH